MSTVNPLSVDPVDLHLSADRLETLSRDVAAAHSRANARIESATAGWVGASGDSLKSLLSDLQKQTKDLCADLSHDSSAYRRIANGYDSMDDQQAEYFIKFRQALP